MNIEIYEDEKDIADLIRKSNSISHLVEIKEVSPFQVSERLQASIQKEGQRENFDLHYLQSILVSSGINGNDEFFMPTELWCSRNTAKDKPFNVEHNCDDIIGHMTNSYVINDDGTNLPENTTIDTLPDNIHIVSQAVLYKHWNNDEKQQRMDQILAELKENKWFVSVECLFPSFDYILRNDNGSTKLISRNSKTSFLTKYLRVYDGPGVYENQKIGRVPRNLILSGKGLVKQPANKNSIIFAKRYEVSNNKIELVYQIKEGVNKMDNALELQYKDTIKKLEADYTQLQASLAKNESKEIQAKLDVVTKDLEARVQEVNVLKASLEKLGTEKVEVVKELDVLKNQKKEAEDKIQKIEAAQKELARLNICKVELGMDDNEAKTYAASLNLLNDDGFKEFIAFNKKFVQAKASIQTDTKVVADTQVLENVQKVTEPALTVAAPVAPTAKEATLKLAASIRKYVEDSVPADKKAKAKFVTDSK